MEDSRIMGKISEIEERLTIIQDDIERIAGRRVGVESTAGDDYAGVLRNTLIDDIESGLERNMIKSCEMRRDCRERFQGFLEEGINDLNRVVKNEELGDRRRVLREMEDGAPFEKCRVCFKETSRLLKKQARVLRSLNIYREEDEQRGYIRKMDADELVHTILDPVSNGQRFRVLQSLVDSPKSFSQLSEVTGLRGGNLLFHIDKLRERELIIQKHERGDYLITDNGLLLLKALAEIYRRILGPE